MIALTLSLPIKNYDKFKTLSLPQKNDDSFNNPFLPSKPSRKIDENILIVKGKC